MVYQYSDWASFLRARLNERKTANPKYSLRAFAKAIGVSPGFLSNIMQSKRQLSPDIAHQIAKRMKCTVREIEYLGVLAQSEIANTPELRTQLQGKLKELRRTHEPQIIDSENFVMIKDWYHIPILEMTYLDDFEFTPKNVAQRLGIPAIQAEVAIDRLIRMGLLQRLKDGTLVKTDAHCVFRTNRRNEAFAAFHRQMMTLGIDAIENSPLDERVVMSQTFCIAEDQLEEAKTLTRDYIQKMAGLFENTVTKQNTYQLNVQFFNLTNSRMKPIRRD